MGSTVNEILNRLVFKRVQFIRGSEKIDLSVTENRHAISNRVHGFHIMGDDDRCYLKLLLKPIDQMVDRIRHDRIQPRSRLIIQNALRMTDNGPGQCDPLSHST